REKASDQHTYHTGRILFYDIPFDCSLVNFRHGTCHLASEYTDSTIFSFTLPSFGEARGLKLILNEEMTKRGICARQNNLIIIKVVTPPCGDTYSHWDLSLIAD